MKSTQTERQHGSPRCHRTWAEPMETRLCLAAGPTVFTDGDGTVVTIVLQGNGNFTLENTVNGRLITATGTDPNSRLRITTRGGTVPTAELHAINVVGGAIRLIDAPRINLTGDLSVTGNVSSIKLGNMNAASQQTISIGGTAQATPVEIRLSAVSDLTIDSKSPIQLLDVSDWDDTGGDDTITTPWIRKINSRGDLAAGLTLSGGGNPALTLREATVKNTVSGTWSIEGQVNRLQFGAASSTFTASVTRNVSRLGVGGNFDGTLAASSIDQVDIRGSLTNAEILAGADLGDDAKFGGVEANEDIYSRGVIGSVSIRGQLINSFIGAGLDPADGVFGNSGDFVTGKKASVIRSLTIRGVLDQPSRIAAGVFPRWVSVGGTRTLPADDPHFIIGNTEPDENPPTIEAALASTDGSSGGFALTSSPSVIGRVTDRGQVRELVVKIRTRRIVNGSTETNTVSKETNVTSLIQPNGTFAIQRARLEQINGSTAFETSDDTTEVQYTIEFKAKDEDGNNSPLVAIKFKFTLTAS